MNVNSYSLFGELEKWAQTIAPMLRMHFTYYPDWTFWVHTDREFSDIGYCKVARQLAEQGLIRHTIVPNDGKNYQARKKCMMMLWRMLPIYDGGVNYVFCRDADSVLTPRQLQCTLEFIRQNKAAHGIQDNPAHDIPLMGGMCGFRCADFKSLTKSNSMEMLLNKPKTYDWNVHGADQCFLVDFVWPRVAGSATIHALQGPNERFHLKHLFDVDISYLSERVRNEGDNFTNYIGAVEAKRSTPEIIDFYNQHGNQAKCELITKIEQDLGYTCQY